MQIAPREQINRTGMTLFTKRYVGLVIACVLLVHLFSLNLGVTRVQIRDDVAYLPVQTREIELMQVPPPVKRKHADTATVKSSIRPSRELVSAVGAIDPRPVEQPYFNEVPELDSSEKNSVQQPRAAASQPDINAQIIEKKVGDESLLTRVDPATKPDPLSESGKDTEKVRLTVPLRVQFPNSRNWTFATTHKSLTVYAPDLPTDFRWKVEHGQYEAYLGAGSLYAKFTKLSRQSYGITGETGLLPKAFTTTQRDGTKIASYFNYEDKQVTFGVPGREPKPLMPGSQDELSVAMQLSAMFLGEPQRYRVGDQIVINVVQRTDARVWIFKVEENAEVNIPAGSIQSIKLTRAPRFTNDTGVSVWLAPSHQYLPVRIRLDYSPDRYDDMKWKGF